VPKVKIDVTAKDKAGSKIKSITGSMLKAQLAFGLLQQGVRILNQTMKKSLEAFKVQEQAEKALEVATKENIKSYKNFASSIQQITTVGDEAILQIQTMASNMGFANDQINQAAQDALSLSKAFKVDLNTAMKLVANEANENYSALTRYIPELKSATTNAEKAAIVQRAYAKGFEIAKGEAETFSGRLQQLKNIQGDTLESFGKAVSIIGIDFVEGMTKATEGLKTFLDNSNNLAKMLGIFSVAKEIVKEFVDQGLKVIKDEAKELGEKWKELVPEMGKGNLVFKALAVTTKILGIGITVAIKTLGIFVKGWIDSIKVIKEAVQVVGTAWDVLSGKKKLADVWQSIKDVGTAYKDLYLNAGKGAVDMVKGVVDEFKTFNTDVKTTAENYEKIWKDANQNVKDNFENSYEDITDLIDEQTDKQKKKSKKTGKEIGADILNWGNALVDGFSQIFNSINDMASMFFDEQLALLSEKTDERLAIIDEKTQAELEMRGLAAETKQEMLQNEIKELEDSLKKETNEEAKADLIRQINEKKDALATQKILDDGEKKKLKIQEDAQKKELKIKKAAFEAQKAASIVSVWLDAGKAIMGWWAGASTLGPIAGPIFAGVMSAATTVLAGVQTGLISGQSFHAQEGGVISTGSMTGDNALLFANKGEAVLRDEDYRLLIDQIRNGGMSSNSFYIDNLTIVSDDPDDFVEKLTETARIESARG
jgi:hypothetical protein